MRHSVFLLRQVAVQNMPQGSSPKRIFVNRAPCRNGHNFYYDRAAASGGTERVKRARRASCSNNLRQMVLAAFTIITRSGHVCRWATISSRRLLSGDLTTISACMCGFCHIWIKQRFMIGLTLISLCILRETCFSLQRVVMCLSVHLTPRSAKVDLIQESCRPRSNGSFLVAFTNYVACVGSQWYPPGTGPLLPLDLLYDGAFFDLSAVDLKDFTDGTSTTILFSERARGFYPVDDRKNWGWWASGVGGDTMFVTFNPINTAKKLTTLSSIFDEVRMYGGFRLACTPAGHYFALRTAPCDSCPRTSTAATPVTTSWGKSGSPARLFSRRGCFNGWAREAVASLQATSDLCHRCDGTRSSINGRARPVAL